MKNSDFFFQRPISALRQRVVVHALAEISWRKLPFRSIDIKSKGMKLKALLNTAFRRNIKLSIHTGPTTNQARITCTHKEANQIYC